MKDAYYFSHDTNARNDPKIIAMLADYKAEGYGWWWIVIETLAEQEGYRLKRCAWAINALALQMQCERNACESFINACVSEYELLSTDGDYFWSESLVRRMQKKEEKRQSRIDKAKKAAEARWGNSQYMQEQCPSNAQAMLNDAKESKVKQSKGEESTERDITTDPQIASSVSLDVLSSLWARYFGLDDALEITLDLMTEFGYEMVYECIEDVGMRTKRPQVPSAYIREMCRNRSGK